MFVEGCLVDVGFGAAGNAGHLLQCDTGDVFEGGGERGVANSACFDEGVVDIPEHQNGGFHAVAYLSVLR